VTAQIRAIIHPITVYLRGKLRMKIPTFAEYSLNTETTQGRRYTNAAAIRGHAKIVCCYVVLTNGDKRSLTCVSGRVLPSIFSNSSNSLAKIAFKSSFRTLNPIEFFKSYKSPLIVVSLVIIKVLLALKLFQSFVITLVGLHFHIMINQACFPDFLNPAAKWALCYSK